MSRSHARVVQRAEDFILEDLGSRNGMFGEGARYSSLAANRHQILLGDRVNPDTREEQMQQMPRPRR